MPPVDTPVKMVRLLISDVGGHDTNTFIFDDEEIQGFLDHRGQDVSRAAATALRTIAGNEALVSKRIKYLELTTDGPAVAKELRELAKELETADSGDQDIDIIEMNVGPFAARTLRRGY